MWRVLLTQGGLGRYHEIVIITHLDLLHHKLAVCCISL